MSDYISPSLPQENLCETCEKFNNIFIIGEPCRVAMSVYQQFRDLSTFESESFEGVKIKYGITECRNYVRK